MGKKNLAVARLSRNKLTAAISLALAIGPVPLLAAPTGGVVTSGTASISQSGSVTNVNQSTQKAAINWQGFSIAPNETVNFLQPNSSAITLNRVVGNERSIIEGALNANGRVFLINSNGVLFTRGSSVNTAGLVASTLNMSDADFEAGNYVFQGNGSSASVINLGTLTADEGGYIALLGNTVSNQGVIAATKGTVALAAGEKITLNFNGDSLLSVTLDEGALNALVENKQAIYADGGKVFLTAKAANEVLGSQVNNTGIVQARTLSDLTQGEIVISAYGGTANIDGTLDASAPTGGDGGSIETSGKKVRLADSAVITTKANSGTNGEWLIGSDGYTIAATGGDITGARLSSLLAADLTNIRINSASGSSSDGSLNVNDALSWNGDSRLTLEASGDVSINSAITATGDYSGLVLAAADDINVNADVALSGSSAALVMNYGGDYYIRTAASYSGTVLDANGNPVANSASSDSGFASITLEGASASLRINGQNYILIHSLSQLDGLDGNNAITGSGAAAAVTNYYALAGDLDASGVSYRDALIKTFTNSTLAGLGNSISNLTISGTATTTGLIGTANGSTIRDFGVVAANISGVNNVGVLVGGASGNGVKIFNSYATGQISARSAAGGLVGAINNNAGLRSTVIQSFADVDVTGEAGSLGGLIGVVTKAVYIDSSHASGDVVSTSSIQVDSIGGLVGRILTSTPASLISNSYATGDVSGYQSVGGLIGYAVGSSAGNRLLVVNSFATGAVTATASTSGLHAGGLIGYAQYVNVDNSYHSTGDVKVLGSQFTNTGGLIGSLIAGSVTNSHAEGSVLVGDSAYAVGGLIGYMDAASSVDRSYAIGKVEGVAGYGVTGSQMGGLVGKNDGSISNSWANVNIKGHVALGGLVGLNSGTIVGSRAMGSVAGYSIGGNAASGAGGLVGSATDGSVIRESTASGSVSGVDSVGGLVGTSRGGVIDKSTASGTVTGTGQGVGGLVGSIRDSANGSTLVITDSYWNSNSTGQTNAIGYVYEGSAPIIQNSQGLTNEQFVDVQHYIDGTIEQVLLERAQLAAERALQVLAEAGEKIGSSLLAESDREAKGLAEMPNNSGFPERPSPIESLLTFKDAGDYGAQLRRIEVDGVVYELEEEALEPAQ